MNASQQRVWDEISEGRVGEIGDFLLEYLAHNPTGNDFVDELVAVYFYRLEHDE